MSFGVCLWTTRRRKYNVSQKWSVIVWLVLNYGGGLSGYEEAGWYWEDVPLVIRQHTAQYWAVTHISVVYVQTQKHTNTSNGSQLIYTKNACRTIEQPKRHSTYSPIWNVHLCTPHFHINRLRVLCTLWQPQTTQSTREVQCTLGKCVVRLGGCACSFWLTHSFGPATIFTCPPLKGAPTIQHPFPPAMYTFI